MKVWNLVIMEHPQHQCILHAPFVWFLFDTVFLCRSNIYSYSHIYNLYTYLSTYRWVRRDWGGECLREHGETRGAAEPRWSAWNLRESLGGPMACGQHFRTTLQVGDLLELLFHALGTNQPWGSNWSTYFEARNDSHLQGPARCVSMRWQAWQAPAVALGVVGRELTILWSCLCICCCGGGWWWGRRQSLWPCTVWRSRQNMTRYDHQ